MFSIYTPEGRSFLGSMEELRQVKKLAPYPEISNKVRSKDEMPADPGSQEFVPQKQAISEYKKLLEKSGEREPVLHAYQIMSRSVKAVLDDWSLAQALSTFRRYPFQVLPVISQSAELLGSLPRKSLYEYMLEYGSENLEASSIADIFLSPDSYVYSAEPVTDVRRIASVLVDNKLDAMPITARTGAILGIVSRTDLLKCLVAEPPLSLWC